MNLKKYLQNLQKMAEKDAESLLTEGDRLFCLQLTQKYAVNEEQEKTEELSKNVKETSSDKYQL